MTAAMDLLVRSRMEPLFWLGVVWLFFAVTESHK